MTHAIVNPPLAIGSLAALSPLERVYFGYLADYESTTRAGYEYHLTRFLSWCQAVQIDPLTIDRTYMALYVRHLSEEVGLRGSTVNTSMTPIRGMYDWALEEGFVDRDPTLKVRLPKIDYRQKYPLDRDELKAIRRAGRELGGRHWALVELLLVVALRISEASTARIENYQTTERGHRVLVLRRKGGKTASLPLPVPVIMALDDAVGQRTRGTIIVCRDGHPIGRSGATGLLNTVIRHSGIGRKVNPHLLRSSVVTNTVEREGIREGQRLAGHQDPRTTSRHYDLSKNDHDTHPSHILSARLTA